MLLSDSCELDAVLRGGIPFGHVTELVGEAGSGSCELYSATAWFILFGHVTELVGEAGSGSFELYTGAAWWGSLWSRDRACGRGGLR
jgi:hypothetical protein